MKSTVWLTILALGLSVPGLAVGVGPTPAQRLSPGMTVSDVVTAPPASRPPPGGPLLRVDARPAEHGVALAAGDGGRNTGEFAQAPRDRQVPQQPESDLTASGGSRVYALLLATLGALGFMMRRRRVV